jgi:NAD(P)H-nitrite reductase large subunit
VSTHHVIVGGGVAALSAAESIRSVGAPARITMVTAEDGAWYSRPGLAYLLTGEVPEPQLTLRTNDELQRLDIVRVQGEATVLQVEAHCVLLRDGTRVPYDRLLIATGAASIPAAFPGAALDGVVQLDSLADARDIIARAASIDAAVVIGGGSTALELVEGLHARGVHTHYLLRGERYWSKVLDRVESAIVESRLQGDGIVVHRQSEIKQAIGRDGRLVGIETTAGLHLPCGLLAVAVGVAPRLGLARSAALDVARGILTNEYLETSAQDVFAAGDVAQVYDPVTRASLMDTLWSSAAAQGRSAGLNMAGMHIPHRKRPAMNVTRVAGLTVTLIGAVGSLGDDPDLLTITRGQSERWAAEPDAWTVSGTRREDRLRVVVSGRAIVGAVVMGDQRMSQPLAHLIDEEVDITRLRPALDAAPDDAMDLLLAFCDDHVRDRAAQHR